MLETFKLATSFAGVRAKKGSYGVLLVRVGKKRKARTVPLVSYGPGRVPVRLKEDDQLPQDWDEAFDKAASSGRVRGPR